MTGSRKIHPWRNFTACVECVAIGVVYLLVRRLPLLLLPLLAACSTVGSDTLATNQMRPHFRVEVNTANNGAVNGGEGPGMTVDLRLADGLSDVSLSAGDAFMGKTEKVPSLTFKSETFLGILSYVARSPSIDSRTLTVSLDRSNGTGAPTSTIEIPPALDLDSPFPSTLAHGATLKLSWKTKVAGAKLGYRTFPCGGVGTTQFDEPSVDDGGSYELTGADLLGPTAPSAPQCLKVLIARKTSKGTLDPAYKDGGSFEAIHNDIYEISITP